MNKYIIRLLLVSIIFFSSNTAFAKVFSQADTIRTIEPESKYILENQLITTLLTRYHYNNLTLNDSLSSVIFDRFIDAIDHGKNYFLQTDIDDFEANRYLIDNFLIDGDIQFYYDVFNVYLQKLSERIDFVNQTLENEFDYTKDEYLEINNDSLSWAKDIGELNERWFKRLKNDALTYKLNGKDWEFTQSTLRKRYQNYANFLNQYNSEDVFQLAMNSFTQSIDPHSNYLSPVTSDNFKIDMSLSLEGIGARLQNEDDYTKIVEIIPGGPADLSKELFQDDKIIGVAQGEDGEFEDIIGWRVTEVVKLIRGEKGTKVRLRILPAGSDLDSKPKELTLIRDQIKLEDQAAKKELIEIENDGKNFRIGVIDIPKFYTDFSQPQNGEQGKSTTTDVRKLILELMNEKIDGLLIDLRNDGGGSLTEAIDLTGLFINNGPVVQVINPDGSIDVGYDPEDGIVYDGPLAVLVNRFSASASEIFASAIQDYGRGIVIGETTYGKGTVQNLIDLNRFTSRKSLQLGQLKLTIAKYYRVTGGTTQRLGVTPDIELPSFFEAEEFGESSEPSALISDNIDAVEFEKYSNVKDFLAALIKKHKERTLNDPDFKFLAQDIVEYKQDTKKRLISLNEQLRIEEKNAKEEKEFERENERRSLKGLKLLEKGETPEIRSNADDDYILMESVRILSDLITLTIG